MTVAKCILLLPPFISLTLNCRKGDTIVFGKVTNTNNFSLTVSWLSTVIWKVEWTKFSCSAPWQPWNWRKQLHRGSSLHIPFTWGGRLAASLCASLSPGVLILSEVSLPSLFTWPMLHHHYSFLVLRTLTQRVCFAWAYCSQSKNDGALL